MNYLFGWNAVAEFILDEFEEQGVHIKSILVDDEYVCTVPSSIRLQVEPYSRVSFQQGDQVINCMGYKDLTQRILIGERLLHLGVLGTFISSQSRIHKSSKIGAGSVLVGDVAIERNCDIGNHGLFWAGSRICHDSSIGKGVFLASGAIVGGECRVGNACSLGFNSTLRQKSALPDNTKVGANRFWRPNA